MERKHLCELLVMERLISEEKESDLRKATQQLTKKQQQERLFELKVCVILYPSILRHARRIENKKGYNWQARFRCSGLKLLKQIVS